MSLAVSALRAICDECLVFCTAIGCALMAQWALESVITDRNTMLIVMLIAALGGFVLGRAIVKDKKVKKEIEHRQLKDKEHAEKH